MGSTKTWLRSIYIILGGMGIILTLASVSQPRSAGLSSLNPVGAPERHCIVEVIDEIDGRLVTGPERCFDTVSSAALAASGSTAGATTTSNTIGLHFTGLWYSGSSIRIVGTTCSGGIWPATGSWNNNIESSRHYCGSSSTVFLNEAGCTGDSRPISSDAPTLYGMNNRTSCVQYG